MKQETAYVTYDQTPDREFISGHLQDISSEQMGELGDRFYSIMRAYWIRESEGWGREMDMPPTRWFEEPFDEGELKGSSLDRRQYDQMLSWYYESRGWDENGIPTKDTLQKQGLGDVAEGLK